MSSHLEKFVRDHREAFDGESPAPELWDRIQSRMQSAKPEEAKKKEAPVRSMPFKRWLSAAAAVLVICISGWLYFSLRQKPVLPGVAGNQQGLPSDTGHALAVKPAITDSPSHHPSEIAQVSADHKTTDAAKPDNASGQEEADYNEEIYHYSRLVEIKHNELKTLQKDEPLLYRQFAGDVNKLDSVYQNLKTQLPKNSNREQLIEAMISNLQLQIGLLNKQLNIIKQIRHSKNQAYEKAYKSV